MKKLLILLALVTGVLVSCTKGPTVQGNTIATTIVSSASGTIDALIQAEPVWYAKSLESWIKVDESYHKGQDVVTLEYLSNRSIEGDIRSSRIGKVIIRTYNGLRCDTLKIYQMGMAKGPSIPELIQDIPGEITAEFPSQPVFRNVDVVITSDGKAEFSVPGAKESSIDGCRIFALGELRIVCGACSNIDSLMEDTFWKESGAQWIYALEAEESFSSLEELGFANCLRVFCSQSEITNFGIYASANVFDRITEFVYERGSDTSFTVYLKEE